VFGALVGAAGAFVVTLARIHHGGRPPQCPDTRADMAIVFGAAIWASGPCPELIARIDRAAELYAEGLVPMIVCCGGRTRDVSEGGVMRELLIERQVPADSVVVDDRGSTSRRALVSVASSAHARGCALLLVSSPYHMHRLMVEARRQGLRALPAPAPLPGLPLLSGFPLLVGSRAGRRRLADRLAVEVREVLAVWWYALPVKPSTIAIGQPAAGIPLPGAVRTPL
jgi:hypothetical protein